MERYNAREHSKLRESPDKRFLRERELLRHIPSVEPTFLYERVVKKVSNDGYISYKGGLYPVPMRLCLTEVMIESVFGKVFRVYDKRGEMVIEHRVRLFDKRVRPEHPEHEEINKRYREKRSAHSSEIVNRFIRTFNDNGKIYVERLRERVGPNLYWHLTQIMRYSSIYSIEDVSDVLRECIEIGTYHKNSVKRLLQVRQMPAPVIEPLSSIHSVSSVDITRDLSFYRMEVFHG